MAIRYTAGDPNNKGFTPLPEGTMNFKIIEEEDCTSKKGNPQHKVRFEVMDGPHAGRQLNVWFSFMPNAIWAWESLVEATGAVPTDTGEIDETGEAIMELPDNALLDCYVTADVSQEEYNDKTNNKLNKIRECTEYAGPYDMADDEPTDEPEPEPKEKAPTPGASNSRRARRGAPASR